MQDLKRLMRVNVNILQKDAKQIVLNTLIFLEKFVYIQYG